MKVGVIGVGAMGREAVRRLLGAKHDVIIWNRSDDAVNSLVAEGAQAAADVSEALQGDVASSLLFDDAAVQRWPSSGGIVARTCSTSASERTTSISDPAPAA
jgi:3-hydroxyisobutyrate dehydrogenase-like beta-hydroxyacid dehydrogenase